MSVWTKVQNRALYENVDMDVLTEALSELELTLDHGVKEISNSYGKSKVEAGLLYKGNQTALGIQVNANKGISLVGDTWRSGIVGDKQADKLINMISQAYQKVKLKKELELQGWLVNTIKKEDKIVLECVQY